MPQQATPAGDPRVVEQGARVTRARDEPERASGEGDLLRVRVVAAAVADLTELVVAPAAHRAGEERRAAEVVSERERRHLSEARHPLRVAPPVRAAAERAGADAGAPADDAAVVARAAVQVAQLDRAALAAAAADERLADGTVLHAGAEPAHRRRLAHHARRAALGGALGHALPLALREAGRADDIAGALRADGGAAVHRARHARGAALVHRVVRGAMIAAAVKALGADEVAASVSADGGRVRRRGTRARLAAARAAGRATSNPSAHDAAGCPAAREATA